MFHSAFHLYFGAFDIILYAAAFLVSLSVSRAICDNLDAPSYQTAAIPVTVDVSTANESVIPPDNLAPSPTLSNPVKISDDDSLEEGNEPVPVPDETGGSEKPILDLSKIKLYQLRKQSVVRLSDLTFSIPETVKRYQLRQKPVIRLTDIENFVEVIS